MSWYDELQELRVELDHKLKDLEKFEKGFNVTQTTVIPRSRQDGDWDRVDKKIQELQKTPRFANHAGIGYLKRLREKGAAEHADLLFIWLSKLIKPSAISNKLVKRPSVLNQQPPFLSLPDSSQYEFVDWDTIKSQAEAQSKQAHFDEAYRIVYDALGASGAMLLTDPHRADGKYRLRAAFNWLDELPLIPPDMSGGSTVTPMPTVRLTDDVALKINDEAYTWSRIRHLLMDELEKNITDAETCLQNLEGHARFFSEALQVFDRTYSNHKVGLVEWEVVQVELDKLMMVAPEYQDLSRHLRYPAPPYLGLLKNPITDKK